jgi:hypothetical protein
MQPAQEVEKLEFEESEPPMLARAVSMEVVVPLND